MLRVLLLCLVLAACGRPLTSNEQAFLETFHGETLNMDRVRLHDGAPTRAVTFRRKPRPRTTCRELILPPVTEAIVTSKPAAVALYNTVLFDRDWYLEDYLPDYPDTIGLIAAMLFAHEITHVWQWQNRASSGYSPLRAGAEQITRDDPYLFELDEAPAFGDFGFEQQASIVEEYVCCRALAPDGPRTARLHALIEAVMPVKPLPASREWNVRLPWAGAEIGGICG
ncbi:MAG: hypothetical protein AAF943_03980 [Pseudomonadota bacterium]